MCRCGGPGHAERSGACRAEAHGAKAGLPSCDADNGGLTLPAGFCALVVHEGGIGEGRHIVVNDNGDIYVILRRGASAPVRPNRFRPGASSDFATRTATAKPTSVSEKFGDVGGTGLELRNGYLYYAAVTHIGRFKLTPGELKPAGPAEIVVDGFPVGGGHAEKDIAFDNAGNVYVNIGLPSNACQIPDRRPGRSRHRSVPAARRSRRHLALQGRCRRTEVHEGSAVCHAACANRSPSRGTTDTSTWR